MTNTENGDLDLVEQYADSLGITPDELFEELDKLEIPDEANSECLSPEDVRLYAKKQLDFTRQAHLIECEDCRALVAACEPTPQQLREFLREVEATRTKVS